MILLIPSILRTRTLPLLIQRNCPIVSSLALLPGHRTQSGAFYHPNHRNNVHKNYQSSVLIRTVTNGRGQSSDTFLSNVPSHSEVILSKLLPKSLLPYGQLMRLDKPTGMLLLLWPSYWSILLATPGGTTPNLSTLGLFLVGAVLMRGAGCTINDLWDKKYDAKVSRTKNRPLASGKISNLSALTFLALQLSGALFVLTRFDTSSIVLGASSMILVVLYPLAKRFTHWAQLILGMTFNWGALLGYSVVKSGLTLPQSQMELLSCDLAAVIPLYLAGISWTLIYDTIYAHQDKTDDLIIGLKSTAIKFGSATKPWLTLFSATMITCLLTSGVVTNQSWPYYASIGIIGAHLTNQIVTLNIHDPEDCWNKFKTNSSIGFILASGLFLSTLFKDKENKHSVG